MVTSPIADRARRNVPTDPSRTRTSSRPHHLRRTGVVVAAAALVAVATVACSGSAEPDGSTGASTSSAPAKTVGLAPGSRHQLVGEDGRFAYAAPRLAQKVSIADGDDGAELRVRIAYDVANPTTSKGVAADRAEITLRVARSMMSMGPQPSDLVHVETKTDDHLSATQGVREYEFDLPADAKRFLEQHGLDGSDEATDAEALQLVSIGVQQYRDLQVVDGEADWIQGSTFDATQGPTKTSDRPGGALTVRNDTATGVYTYPSSNLEPVPQAYGANLYPNPDEWTVASPSSNGVPIALSGQSGSCFYQGTDGSNPEGFDVTLSPGMAVTQTIVANDMTDNLPFNESEAASVADATEVVLKTAVTALDTALSLVFGGPFTLVISAATDLIDVSQYCNNQPNLMQLGAVVASTGQGSNSTMWAAWDACDGGCGGFANVYSSPWESAAPTMDANMSTQSVQLAPDSVNTYQRQPLWLAQTPIQGCGIGDADDANTSGCTSTNLISLRWSQVMPCPFNNGLQPAQGNVIGDGSYCYQPAPTSPEIPSCGTNNAECVSYDPDE